MQMLFQSDEIWKVIETINSEDVSPKMGFRRNKSIYELVCYVNNIIGCYLSKRSEPIPIFINRIRAYLDEKKIEESDTEYCERVLEFTELLEAHFIENGVSIKW
jgi:hypothetical protein